MVGKCLKECHISKVNLTLIEKHCRYNCYTRELDHHCLFNATFKWCFPFGSHSHHSFHELEKMTKVTFLKTMK